jgi:hypothetical protein
VSRRWTGLLALDPGDIAIGLRVASAIPGLGIVGASGLLSLMYPSAFGLVDEFVVRGLREVEGLKEAAALARMSGRRLGIRDGAILIGILRRKGTDLSCLLDAWAQRNAAYMTERPTDTLMRFAGATWPCTR